MNYWWHLERHLVTIVPRNIRPYTTDLKRGVCSVRAVRAVPSLLLFRRELKTTLFRASYAWRLQALQLLLTIILYSAPATVLWQCHFNLCICMYVCVCVCIHTYIYLTTMCIIFPHVGILLSAALSVLGVLCCTKWWYQWTFCSNYKVILSHLPKRHGANAAQLRFTKSKLFYFNVINEIKVYL